MQINGGVRFCEQGIKASIRAMHVQSEVLGMINENVAGFDKVGYQRREPVVSSFTEYTVNVNGKPKNTHLLRSLNAIWIPPYIVIDYIKYIMDF